MMARQNRDIHCWNRHYYDAIIDGTLYRAIPPAPRCTAGVNRAVEFLMMKTAIRRIWLERFDELYGDYVM